jgi:hypothetical protein
MFILTYIRNIAVKKYHLMLERDDRESVDNADIVWYVCNVYDLMINMWSLL